MSDSSSEPIPAEIIGIACGIAACVACYKIFGGLPGPVEKISFIISFFAAFWIGTKCADVIKILFVLSIILGIIALIALWIFS